MALTLTKIDEDVWGKTRVHTYNITLDSSYPTNGYKASLGFSAHAFGLQTILGLRVIGINAAGSGIIEVRYDYVNIALMAFRVATFTPAGSVAAPVFTGVAHAHDQVFKANPAANAVTMAANSLHNASAGDLTVVGAGADGGIQNTTAGGTNSAPAFTGTAQGQVALAEVSNAVNLSAVTIRAQIYGKA